jgi:hypothetical protein
LFSSIRQTNDKNVDDYLQKKGRVKMKTVIFLFIAIFIWSGLFLHDISVLAQDATEDEMDKVQEILDRFPEYGEEFDHALAKQLMDEMFWEEEISTTEMIEKIYAILVNMPEIRNDMPGMTVEAKRGDIIVSQDGVDIRSYPDDQLKALYAKVIDKVENLNIERLPQSSVPPEPANIGLFNPIPEQGFPGTPEEAEIIISREEKIIYLTQILIGRLDIRKEIPEVALEQNAEGTLSLTFKGSELGKLSDDELDALNAKVNQLVQIRNMEMMQRDSQLTRQLDQLRQIDRFNRQQRQMQDLRKLNEQR